MELFYVLVIAHFIADFILQGNHIATNKRLFNFPMLLHALIAAIAFFGPLARFTSNNVLIGSAVVFVSHAIIDAFRVEIMRRYKINFSKYSFWALLGIDQILHISVLYLVFSYLVENTL